VDPEQKEELVSFLEKLLADKTTVSYDFTSPSSKLTKLLQIVTVSPLTTLSSHLPNSVVLDKLKGNLNRFLLIAFLLLQFHLLWLQFHLLWLPW